MKKLIATIAALTLALAAAWAQDLAAVTELYNSGAEAVQTDKAAALQAFEQALEQATALGEDGAEIVANCKSIIPNIKMSLAKDLVKASKFEDAIAALKDVQEVADKYEAFDVFDGFADCFDDIRRCGRVYGGGADKKGEVKDLPAYNEAYELGKSIQ